MDTDDIVVFHEIRQDAWLYAWFAVIVDVSVKGTLHFRQARTVIVNEVQEKDKKRLAVVKPDETDLFDVYETATPKRGKSARPNVYRYDNADWLVTKYDPTIVYKTEQYY